MDQRVDSALSLGAQILWVEDPTARAAITLVVVIAGAIFLLVFLPLLVRLGRLALLRRRLGEICETDDSALAGRREAMQSAFEASPLGGQWTEYLRRRASALLEGDRDLAAFRFADVLANRPTLPTGARRSLLPVLPGLFLAVGILGTFAGLTLALQDLVPAQAAAVVTAESAERERIAGLVDTVGLALRSSLWGLIFSILAALGGRWLEGRFYACAEELDGLVERLYGSVSQGELATHFARFQAEGFDRLREELATTTRDLSSNLEDGLGRIERSTVEAAGLISEEQRGALAGVVDEVSSSMRRGVEEHLGGLRQALERAVSHQGEVTGGLELAFERMAQSSDANQQVTRSLEEAARTVREASEQMDRSASNLEPVIGRLGDTGDAIDRATERINQTQDLTTRSVESVRSSIEHTAGTMREQREFVETGLGEIRETLRHLSRGLGEELSQALRSVDEALEGSVGRLRETLLASNETIDRISLPMRAAEGTTREMHAALERARTEVTALGDWLIQSLTPVRGSLAHLDDRTGTITRALVEFSSQLGVIDKSVDALRASMQEEGRRFRSASSSLGARIDRALGDFSNLDDEPLEAGPLADDPALDDIGSTPPAAELAEPAPAPRPETPESEPAPAATTLEEVTATPVAEAEEISAVGEPPAASAGEQPRPHPPAPEPGSNLAPESGGRWRRVSVFAPPEEAGAADGTGAASLPARDAAAGSTSAPRTFGAAQPPLSRMHGVTGLTGLLSPPDPEEADAGGPADDRDSSEDSTRSGDPPEPRS